MPIILSRFFDDNVRLVAGICSRCYLDDDDIKIVAVNRKFLQQIGSRESSNNKSDLINTDSLRNETNNIKNNNYWPENRPFIHSGFFSNSCSNNTEGIEDSSGTRMKLEFEREIPLIDRAHFNKSKKVNLAKLCALEKKLPEPLWHPPKSPHNLIEETLFHNPWSLLVATIFLNRTSCMCARPHVEIFLKDFSSPHQVLKKVPEELEKYFFKLGLHKRRAQQVWRMSHDYVHKNWKNAKELHGIGKYGEDAYRMFVLGDLNVEPTDRFLRIYRDWAKLEIKTGRETS